jgi:hypothetical protein
MPLRDHFRPPTSRAQKWEALHAHWPSVILQDLRRVLPAGYVAAPGVHHGVPIEVDVSAYESDTAPRFSSNGGGGTAVVSAPAELTLQVETTIDEYDEYEISIYDVEFGRQLVAAVEIVSPANKDRPVHRNSFVGKCAALLQKGVAVSIVDVVTVKHFNLYAELLEFIGHPHADRAMGADPPTTYAVSCRWVERGKKTILEGRSHALVVGQPLPTLPLWLAPELVVPLELEAGYERACHELWIP